MSLRLHSLRLKFSAYDKCHNPYWAWKYRSREVLTGVLNMWNDNSIKALCHRLSPLAEFSRSDCEEECDIWTPIGWGCCRSPDEPKARRNQLALVSDKGWSWAVRKTLGRLTSALCCTRLLACDKWYESEVMLMLFNSPSAQWRIWWVLKEREWTGVVSIRGHAPRSAPPFEPWRGWGVHCRTFSTFRVLKRLW